METAKVDIRKLQLLNDRINQSIDALNQVRLSVHGLSHTAGINPNLPNLPMTAFGQGLGQQPAGFPQAQVGFPQVPMGFPQVQQGFPQPFAGGLSHTAQFQGGGQAGWNPYAAQGGVQGGLNPYAGFGGGFPAIGVTPYAAGLGGVQGGWNPYAAATGQLGGLSHSTGVDSPDLFDRPNWTDPLLAVRVAQTFPYAQYAVPPVVTLY
ncbi:MAG TPA: hypothetical protein VKY89_01640 [Thermoanaerobaculia bacterium]|nr:hypothetical protein [Thermoanaerobaculia bacterium]